jgi:hypothetical protein
LAEKKNWIAKSVQQADPADLFRLVSLARNATLCLKGTPNKMPPTFIFCSVLSSVLRVFGTARVLLSFDVAALDTMGQPLRDVGDCYVSRQRVDLNAFFWLLCFSDTGRDMG